MTIQAGPCDLVAVSRIDGVMRAVKKSLLPLTNVTEEVTALHNMYLQRKCNVQCVVLTECDANITYVGMV